jgi:hypothetical protein
VSRLLPIVLLIAAALVAWLPREEPITADELVAEAPAGYAEPIPAVELKATADTPPPAFAERWELAFPVAQPVHRLVLDIAPAVGKTAAGRLTSGGGDPTGLLERAAVVLFDDPQRRPVLPPAAALDVSLDLLGERLTQGEGALGSTIVAGAFVTEPAGGWRVHRMTIGAGGPQCFLGLHRDDGIGVLLLRSAADGPAIQASLRSLVQPGT